MSRVAVAFIVLVVWAGLYLPGLGSLEIKGEEGRRILPAVTMLETGNWIVPQVGSEPYFRKPPLVNWLVAASFRLSGRRNEWAARMPSALCVLAVALAFATVARASLGAGGSLVAALLWLTTFGLVEKGRLIEIEALYVSLGGLATICWLAWWEQKRSRWLTWIVPWVFLGLGLLAKGPAHLLFFYAVAGSVLYRARELRLLGSIQHWLGIGLMLAIFAAWAVPCLQMMHAAEVAGTWSRQFSGRMSGEDFRFGGWVQNIPRGLGYLLPWALFLPLLRGARFRSEREGAVAWGLAWGGAVSFVAVSLLPGSLARYTMPLLAPACWLLALLLTTQAGRLPDWSLRAWRVAIVALLGICLLGAIATLVLVRFDLMAVLLLVLTAAVFVVWLRQKPQWEKAREVARLVLATAGAAVVLVCTYATGLVPVLQIHQKVKADAARIDAAIPAGERLYAVDPDYQPFLFYVRAPLTYVSRVAEVPAQARYLLVQPAREAEAATSERWAPRRARPVLRLTDYRKRTVILFEVK